MCVCESSFWQKRRRKKKEEVNQKKTTSWAGIYRVYDGWIVQVILPCGLVFIGLLSSSLSVAKTVDIAPTKQVCCVICSVSSSCLFDNSLESFKIKEACWIPWRNKLLSFLLTEKSLTGSLKTFQRVESEREAGKRRFIDRFNFHRPSRMREKERKIV